jgi:hypothetical protein
MKRPRVTQLRHELDRKDRIIRLLNDRIEVQIRQIEALERTVASKTVPETEPQTAKAGAQ